MKNVLIGSLLCLFLCVPFSCGSENKCTPEKMELLLVSMLQNDVMFVYSFSTIRCFFPENTILSPESSKDAQKFIDDFEKVFERITPYSPPSERVKTAYLSMLESFKTVKRLNLKIERLNAKESTTAIATQIGAAMAEKEKHLEEFNKSYPLGLQTSQRQYFTSVKGSLKAILEQECKIKIEDLSEEDKANAKEKLLVFWNAAVQRDKSDERMKSCLNNAGAQFDGFINGLFN